MSRKRVQNLSDTELVERFVEISLAQDLALLRSEISKFNRLFDQKTAALAELKSRGADQRRLLLNLFTHDNAQVRLNAAKATLAVAPQTARNELQKLVDSKEYPQAGDAGMCLWNLDRGVFKPT
jgi:hypothetical protein